MEENYNINLTTLKILKLYTTDYTKAIHVRKVSRAIQTDVKAVGIHLDRLENHNILQSSINGRNKEYKLNLDNIVTKYYLTLAETYQTINYLENNYLIKRLTNEIPSKIEGTILLFGSYATGDTTDTSDIDLLIISEEKTPTKAINETGRLMGKEINIQTITPNNFQNGLKENDPLIKEAVKNQIVLKGIESLVEQLWRYHANP